MKTSPEEYQEYMNRLQEIAQDQTVQMMIVPEDEPRFIIDSNSRNIFIPDEFTFLGVLRDTNAETIYFEIDRYFDGEDLSKHTCVIQYIAVSDMVTANENVYKVSEMDVNTVPGKIIFPWTIKQDVTEYNADVMFSIRFYSLTQPDPDTGDVMFSYCFNTKAVSLPVLDTLDVGREIVARYPAVFEEWDDRMQQLAYQAEGLYSEAERIYEELSAKIDSFDEIIDGKVEASVGEHLDEKMERYVIRLIKNADNTYKMTSIDDTDLTFNEVYEITRKLNEYVVVVYGNSKLRPQYVSTNEIMFIGLDRSTNSKILRILYTPTRLTYETFILIEDVKVNGISVVNNIIANIAVPPVDDVTAIKSNMLWFDGNGYLNIGDF